MEKEELIEAAEQHTKITIPSDYHSFIKGANWQAKRMYSEEEVMTILHNYRNHFEIYRNLQVLPDMFFGWFEQFKKKEL